MIIVFKYIIKGKANDISTFVSFSSFYSFFFRRCYGCDLRLVPNTNRYRKNYSGRIFIIFGEDRTSDMSNIPVTFEKAFSSRPNGVSLGIRIM